MTRKPSYSSFFSAWSPDFKNVIFEKIHWAHSEVVEVKRSFSRSPRPNFGFHLIFTSFHLEFWSFWVWVGCPKDSKHCIFDLNRTFQILRISDSNIFWLNLNKIAKKNIIIKKEAVKYIFEILYLNKPVFQSHYFWVL